MQEQGYLLAQWCRRRRHLVEPPADEPDVLIPTVAAATPRNFGVRGDDRRTDKRPVRLGEAGEQLVDRGFEARRGGGVELGGVPAEPGATIKKSDVCARRTHPRPVFSEELVPFHIHGQANVLVGSVLPLGPGRRCYRASR